MATNTTKESVTTDVKIDNVVTSPEFHKTVNRIDDKIDNMAQHVRSNMERLDSELRQQVYTIKDSIHENEVSSASYPSDMNASIEKYDAKKTASRRAFNSMLGTALGMFLTILGMIFSGLWFSIESEDFKVSQKMEINQLMLKAELKKEMAEMRFESLLANSKLHDNIEAGAKVIATNKNFVDAYKARLFSEHLGVFRDPYGAGELPDANTVNKD